MRIRIAGVIVVLIVMLGPARLAAQEAYFTEFPIWSSAPANLTTSVALGDVDGDGDLDLVCGNREGSNTLYENIGGAFSSTPIWSSGPTNYTTSVALGDVDGDGDLDLVCGNHDENTLYENSGGTFSSAPIWSSVPTNLTISVALGDVDGDGDLDLVCGNTGYYIYGESNTLYENIDGKLAFTPKWFSELKMCTARVALGDVDRDGDLDLVCGNAGEGSPFNTLYDNTGGTFSSTPMWMSAETNETSSIALGDVDGDGDLDLVCGNSGEFSAPNTFYENAGGMFVSTPMYFGGAASEVSLGDVDGDGDLDLVCTSDRKILYENTGGTFASTPVWSSGPTRYTGSIALGDVDGDGDLDLLCGNSIDSNTLYENVSGSFASTSMWSPVLTDNTNNIALGDLDGDGDLDLVCGNYGENTLYENADGMFASTPKWSSESTNWTYGIALGDVDEDGDLDLVCGDRGENTIYENVDGMFASTPKWSSDSTNWTHGIALGDVDGDGDLDLVCGNYGEGDRHNTLYENTGNTFTLTPVWFSGPINSTMSVALGDVDGDGDLDLVCGNWGENTLYENTGGIFSYTPVWYSDPMNNTHCVVLGDVDGDGDLDLVCGNTLESNTLYENIGGTFTSTPTWFSGPTKDTRSVALGDVDGDGDLDLVCGNHAETSTTYENIGGIFTSTPIPSSGPTNTIRSIALGDVDGDGDLDLVCGNYNQNALYSNTMNTVYKGDPLAPTNQLPNNGPFIGSASAGAIDENHYRAIFSVYDVEADDAWIVPEYQLYGQPQWRPAYLVGGGTRFGPVTAGPGGVTDSLEWDVTPVPFDHRDVVLRLRTVEIPGRISTIQHSSSYLWTVGRIVPVRPELSSSADSILYSKTAITVGDTASHELILSNSGTADLRVSQVTLPSDEMRIDLAAPFTLQQGQGETATVYLEPRTETVITGFVTIASNDPVTPSRSIVVTTDIRPLDVTHRILKASDVIPLGEAVTVVVTPALKVNVERGHLMFRPAGAPAFPDSIALAPFEDEFVAVVPGEKVTEDGLEYYVRVENSGVFGTDPPGAPDSFYSQAVESPTGVMTEPVPNSGAEYLAGREIKVYAIMPTGTRFRSGALHYREGGSDDYMVDSLVPGDAFPEAAVPDSMVGPRGIEYWVDVETETALLSDPPAAPAMHPRTIPVTVQDLVEPRLHAGGEGTGAYRMMSIPLRFGEDFTSTIEALLSDQPAFGPSDPVKWRSWVYLPESGTYGELGDESLAARFRPEPGRAFWLISRENHRISTAPVSGLSTPTDGPFALELTSGWNMAGSPFVFPVSWDSVRVDTLLMGEAAGVSVDPPLGWNGAYSYDVPTMEPFEGYWIYNRTDGPVTLYVPPEETVAETSPAWLAAASPEGDFRMALRVHSGDREDPFALIGTSPRAVRDIDRFDRMKPPPAPGQGISLYFVAQAAGKRCYRLSADIRSNPAGGSEWGEVWSFDVMKSVSDDQAGEAATITVKSIMNVPVDAGFVLIDRMLDRRIDLDEDTQYTFYLGKREYVATEEEARFRIIAGSESFVREEATRLLELPHHAALRQNYPNPFNPSTIIRYDVAEPGMVDLRIYSVNGELVRVLEARHRERGRYEVGWNGENERGERVASGIYFYRLTAPGYSKTRKMVLLR